MLFTPGIGSSLLTKKIDTSGGLLGSMSFPSDYEKDCIRSEILLCLLCACSTTLFSYPRKEDEHSLVYQPVSNPFLEYLVGKISPEEAMNMFLLMVGEIVTYDPIGWGVPYNYLVFADVKEKLMERSLHLLCLLLDYRSSSIAQQNVSRDSTEDAIVPTIQDSVLDKDKCIGEKVIVNFFCDILSGISSVEDFVVLWKTFSGKLDNPIYASSTWLPHSTKAIRCHHEFVAFFWHLIRCNKRFFSWVTKECNTLEVVYPLVFSIAEGRKDLSQLMSIQMSIFILYQLSTERSFAVQLNKPFDKYPTSKHFLPVQLEFNTYADFFISSLLHVIQDGVPVLELVWEPILIVISNISVFQKQLSKTTSNILVRMFVQFTRKRFLFSAPHRFGYCGFLLEIFNNVLQYQFHGNEYLLYALIAYRQYFYDLSNLKADEENTETLGSVQPNQMDWQLQGGQQSLPTLQPSQHSHQLQEQQQKSLQPSQQPQQQSHQPPQEQQPPSLQHPQQLHQTPEEQPQQPHQHLHQPSEQQQAPSPSEPHKTEVSLKGPVLQLPPQDTLDEKVQTKPWKPTNEWILQWKQGLPLFRVVEFLNGVWPSLAPNLKNNSSDEQIIMKYLRETTFVGLLSAPQPIFVRPFIPLPKLLSLVTEFIWKVIFLHTLETDLFLSLAVRLFAVVVK
eukprot:TRINITY_DN4217_c0_g3_i23.p1 TRINITY_DN4217_c0_g3~~TRINITY_DN4217_c0_g3_i23.p1  ORF type:complete len:673 (-),score=147.97 TRINITY_DN4217_c0_g3_i23:168-2186(-)